MAVLDGHTHEGHARPGSYVHHLDEALAIEHGRAPRLGLETEGTREGYLKCVPQVVGATGEVDRVAGDRGAI